MKTAFVLNADSEDFKVNAAIANEVAIKHNFDECWIICSLNENICYEQINFENIRILPVYDQWDVQAVCLSVKSTWQETMPELLVFEGSLWGDDLAAQVSCLVNASVCLGVKEFYFEEGCLKVNKPVYSNNLIGEIQLNKKPYCLSLSRRRATEGENKTVIKQNVIYMPKTDKATNSPIIESSFIPNEKGDDLADADFVIAIGRGAKNKDGVKAVEEASQEIGAQLGVSRAVTMNGWAEVSKLIGASGKIIAPEVCLALGVSGAAAFTAGIENSKLIIAVNTDENAPVFRIADVGIVDDYKEILNTVLPLMKEYRYD